MLFVNAAQSSMEIGSGQCVRDIPTVCPGQCIPAQTIYNRGTVRYFHGLDKQNNPECGLHVPVLLNSL